MDIESNCDNVFFLDDSSPFEISGASPEITFSRWQYAIHYQDKRFSLTLSSDESLKTTKNY